ncbi:hypothetical protein TIFTF001_031657 [Ficus carica]|uniref:Retrotransposon Copia-like N-terminal domain-containing protein n=1 Tax=Ficus carica TaxID=3494 RepID=A0AA88E1T6_FICCA|nr:hypothetical protein TIFTF001_031657 [Ficus carica]
MAQTHSDVAQPITIILNGSNYTRWAQAIRSCFKGRKLWRYATGEIKKPAKIDSETTSKFEARHDDWNSNNHKIVTWITNTSVPSINMSFGDFETTKELWDFLSARYASGDLAQQFQLLTTLQHINLPPLDDTLTEILSEENTSSEAVLATSTSLANS